MSEKPSDLSRHRFFRAMVVMGSGLALGCGGVSEREGSPGTGDGGSSGSGTGGSPNSGGSAGTATSTGGTFSVAGGGGSGGVATGGAAGMGGSPTPLPNCPTTQWYSPSYPLCGDGGGLVLPVDSVCDPMRPASPEDCAAGSKFACLKATSSPNGIVFPKPQPYACECVSDVPNCRAQCGELYSADAQCEETEGADTILCGCTIVVLK